jgi:hypothetical protein
LEGIGKTVLVGLIETLSQHFCGETEEEYENSVSMTDAGVPGSQLWRVLEVLWRNAIVLRTRVKRKSAECVCPESWPLKFCFADPEGDLDYVFTRRSC